MSAALHAATLPSHLMWRTPCLSMSLRRSSHRPSVESRQQQQQRKTSRHNRRRSWRRRRQPWLEGCVFAFLVHSRVSARVLRVGMGCWVLLPGYCLLIN
jgi:hypothetical protein